MTQLLWLWITPFLASFAMFFLSCLSNKTIKPIAFILSLLPLFMLALKGITGWVGEQFYVEWIPSLSISLHFAVDSLSLLFVCLTAVVIPIAILAQDGTTISSPSLFYGLILFLQGLLIAFFTARDLVLFAVFWEAMLFPLYFFITLWGKTKRYMAALKFLIYMITGSAFMLAAVLGLYFAANFHFQLHTFDMDVLSKIAPTFPYAKAICAVFLLAFVVKTPLFPFHGWLVETYYQAPIAGTILLSALLSKAGIYGILRLNWEFFPEIMQEWSMPLLILSIIGALYAGLAAWRQVDFKRLVAYSSLSHVNVILAGLFVSNQIAHEGAILQALNHGVTITGLFLIVGWLEQRLGTTSMTAFSGIVKIFPSLCWLTLLFVLSSIAFPTTNSFIGELLILYGLFGEHPVLAAVLGLVVILSAMYMLRWLQRLYFGPLEFSHLEKKDISRWEWSIALPLIFLIFWIGLYPKPVIHQLQTATQKHAFATETENS